MAAIEHVRPGAVISSDFFNQLIDRMNDFEERLSTVQNGGGASASLIDHFDPPNQVEVGQILTMFGNFDFPPALNTVTVDGVAVPSFRPLSNDAHLIFVVPNVSVSQSGRNVPITVASSKGTAQKSYRLLPASPSTVPSPVITAAVDVQTSAPLLRTGRTVRVTGTSFAATPAENIIHVKFIVGSATITYPKQGQPALTIDASQTNTTQIVFTMPIFDEIGVGFTVTGTLEIGVGAAVPGAFPVTILKVPAA